MKILFLTISPINSIWERSLYSDLLRKFYNEGHELFIVSALERREKRKTYKIEKKNLNILRIRTLNYQKTKFIEKIIAIITLGPLFYRNIIKSWGYTSYDLLICTTPPVTYSGTVKKLKKKVVKRNYLLLKDFFAQPLVDLGVIKRGGIIHKIFERVERNFFLSFDKIGCMSFANKKYLLNSNPFLDPAKVEINPNSIEPVSIYLSNNQKLDLRKVYGIPNKAVVFIFAGNIGIPQAIPFLKKVLEAKINDDRIYFLIIGSGSEYHKLETWYDKLRPQNVTIKEGLPKNEYDNIVRICDVGIVFLDERYTVPNYPSRILSFLECKLPILAATDEATDIRELLVSTKIGLWSKTGDLDSVIENIDMLTENKNLRIEYGDNGYRYLLENNTVNTSYEIIMKDFIN